MNLFLDVYPLSVHQTNSALEYIYKSTHDHGGDGIWSPHESLLIRRLVELFTRRGLDRLEHVKQQILAWEAGEHHRAGGPVVTAPGMMERWSESELALVKLYLESLPPSQWSLDDHMMAVDYVVQRYLPADELQTEAEWLSTRAGLMGKVQANMAATATPAMADKILAALPSTVQAAASQFSLKAQEKAVLDFARVRTAENVRALTESVRHQLRGVVVQHLADQQTKVPGTPGEALQTKLLDTFASLNRDWRRIAVTEAGEAQTQGYVASLQPGAKVKRIEQYPNACHFCKKIHGVVATVVSPDHPDKDPHTMIWPGKNNIGRSASPRKRVGNELVPRTPDEMWWLPAGLAHPHCRGRWVPAEIEEQPGDDPDFAEWLKKTLSSE